MKSIRRELLDRCFEEFAPLGSGKAIDIGGENQNLRGSFNRAAYRNFHWLVVNIDEGANPDLVSDASEIPLPSNSFELIIMSEVLEHLESPDAALREVGRLLTPSGQAIITMPFLYQVHGDPHDFQRWTPQKFRIECQAAGLRILELKPMGGLIAVVFDLLRSYVFRLQSNPIRAKLLRYILRSLRKLVVQKSTKEDSSFDWITTGWWVVVQRL